MHSSSRGQEGLLQDKISFVTTDSKFNGYRIDPGDRFVCLAFEGLFPLPRLADFGAAGLDLDNGSWAAWQLPFDPRGCTQLGERDREQLLRATFVLSVRRRAPLPMAQIEPENEALPQRAENLLYGLVVSGGVGYKKAYRVAGAHLGDGVEARLDLEQQTFFPSMYRQAGQPPAPLTTETFHSARRFADRLERVRQEHVLKAKDDLAYWRFISGLSAFLDGCRTRVDRYDVRLHQFVRGIESFLPTDAFGARKFAQYSRRLVTDSTGVNVVSSLNEMYRLRNKFEHHEHWKEANLSGPVPERTVVARLHQAEALCREIYRRMFANSSDNSHFWRTALDIGEFWSKGGNLDAIWGVPFDLGLIS